MVDAANADRPVVGHWSAMAQGRSRDFLVGLPRLIARRARAAAVEPNHERRARLRSWRERLTRLGAALAQRQRARRHTRVNSVICTDSLSRSLSFRFE